MPAVHEITINSFQEFMNAIETHRVPTDDVYWFRGIGDVNYKLTPSICRHKSVTSVSNLIDLEYKIFQKFKQKSIPFQPILSNDDWSHLFLMQHYGVPTRLLDWSENPFVSLYFAITSAESKAVSGVVSSDAAVWIMNTKKWNSKILPGSWKGKVVSIPDNPIEGYKPCADATKLSQDPIAITGYHNNPRIVAQRGVFVIYGQEILPMEDICSLKHFEDNTLVRLRIPSDKLTEIGKAMFSLGYSDSMIYPDLDGLAKEIKRQEGFEV